MIEPYRVMLIEDNENDTGLIQLAFRKHDEFFLDFFPTGEDGLEQFVNGSYDLVSIDLSLPGMSGLDVLECIREFDQETPVVMVTGRGTEEIAVVAFQSKATNYVVKSLENFENLPYIFENLINEARFNKKEKAMGIKLRRSERIHRSIVENSLTGIYIHQDGLIKVANSKFAEIFNCDPGQINDIPLWTILHPNDLDCVSKQKADISTIYEFRITRKDGSSRWVEARIVATEYEDRCAILGNLADITSRKESELNLVRRNRELSVLYGILSKAFHFGGDLQRILEASLSEIVSEIGGAKASGIFLLGEDRLTLRFFAGRAEKLAYLIEENWADTLLEAPQFNRVSKEGESHFIASVPIIINDAAEGAIVLAGKMDAEIEDGWLLPFIENVALHIGRLMEIHGYSDIAHFKELEPHPSFLQTWPNL
jgi:PAS domain S-box-containing protein